MAIFTDARAITKGSRIRVAYGVVLVLAFIVTEVLRLRIRPAVYASGGGPRWLFDSIGNSGGAVVQIFFTLAVLHSNFRQGLRVVAFIVVGYIGYEFLQPVLPKGTFDPNDIIGTIVGGAIALVLLVVLKAVLGDRPDYATAATDAPGKEA